MLEIAQYYVSIQIFTSIVALYSGCLCRHVLYARPLPTHGQTSQPRYNS